MDVIATEGSSLPWGRPARWWLSHRDVAPHTCIIHTHTVSACNCGPRLQGWRCLM